MVDASGLKKERSLDLEGSWAGAADMAVHLEEDVVVAGSAMAW